VWRRLGAVVVLHVRLNAHSSAVASAPHEPPPSPTRLSPSRITDVHIHVQPWRELKPHVLEIMWRAEQAHRDLMIQVMDDPRALLEVMDRAGVCGRAW